MIAARPFVDAPVGDVGDAHRAAERAARRWGFDPPTSMRVGMNALFASGPVVLRVGRPTVDGSAALELADCLRGMGVPVPVPARDDVVVDGALTVSAWHAVEPVDEPIDWEAVGVVVRRVHEIGLDDVPRRYPLPSPTSFAWWDFDRMLADARGDIDPVAYDALVSAVERNRGWDEMHDTVVCHGDVHPGNVMMSAGGVVVLDWDLMCIAPCGWDHAMLLSFADRWGGDTGAYPAFARGYGRDLGSDAVTVRFAELRNVAATLMRVRAGRTDESARIEAERRLRHWRGEPDAPPWRAQ